MSIWFTSDFCSSEKNSKSLDDINTMLTGGYALDATLTDRSSIISLEKELSNISDQCDLGTQEVFRQLLLTSSAQKILVWSQSWKEQIKSEINFFSLHNYPWIRKIRDLMVAVSSSANKKNSYPTLFSFVPIIFHTQTYGQFFHREAHIACPSLQNELRTPEIYRNVADIGIRNSSRDLNVNLVPRHLLLGSEGNVARKYQHLFHAQKKYHSSTSDFTRSTRKLNGLVEQQLPFPYTKRDLLPGHAFIWRDELFFHGVYRKANANQHSRLARTRSVLVVCEFNGEVYRNIGWKYSLLKAIDSQLIN